MNNLQATELAAFLLRVSLALVILMHSLYLKLYVYTLSGTADYFSSLGLPQGLAYAVFLIEVVSGLGLLLGAYSKHFSAVLIPILIGATWAHSGNGWLFTNQGGGWEYPLFLTVALIVQSLLGNGLFSLMKPLYNNDASQVSQ